jgi:hypothetical protein
MQISRHNTLEQEKIYQNGTQKQVHAVIKNLPFDIELSSRDLAHLNFHTHTIEARLLYDDEEEKEVHFVKVPPIEYNCQVNKAGDRAIVSTKLSVLSSQHEDMLFRIKFVAMGSGRQVISEAIKVVSKPAQLKKNRARPRAKKRTLNDSVLDSLGRIEGQQLVQKKMLDSLMQTLTSLMTTASPSPAKKVKVGPPSKKASELFEEHLVGLIGAYNMVSTNEERAEVVRRAVRSSSVHATEKMTELIDCLWVEGLNREVGANICTGSPYCSESYSGGPALASPPISLSTEESSESSPLPPPLDLADDLDSFYNQLLAVPPVSHEGDYNPQF